MDPLSTFLIVFFVGLLVIGMILWCSKAMWVDDQLQNEIHALRSYTVSLAGRVETLEEIATTKVSSKTVGLNLDEGYAPSNFALDHSCIPPGE